MLMPNCLKTIAISTYAKAIKISDKLKAIGKLILSLSNVGNATNSINEGNTNQKILHDRAVIFVTSLVSMYNQIKASKDTKGIDANTPPYPSYSYLANLMVSDPDAQKAKTRIEAIALHLQTAISETGEGTELLGPVECPLARVKSKFRFHLLLRDRNRPRLHQVLDALATLPTANQEGLLIDVDPMSIM